METLKAFYVQLIALAAAILATSISLRDYAEYVPTVGQFLVDNFGWLLFGSSELF